MDFIDFQLWKAIGLCVLAFIGGLLGLTGQPEDQPQEQEPRDTHIE
jgi:hypothetical protein